MDSIHRTLKRIEQAMAADCAERAENMRVIRRLLGDKGSFYEQHDGVRYKHALLEQAREALKSGGRISATEVDALWADVAADGKVSEVERRTLGFVRDTFRLTDCAARRLDEHLAVSTEEGDV